MGMRGRKRKNRRKKDQYQGKVEENARKEAEGILFFLSFCFIRIFIKLEKISQREIFLSFSFFYLRRLKTTLLYSLSLVF